MLSRNLSESKEFIQSYPIPVHFAGWESDTVKLARGGWDLAMEQHMDFHYKTPQITLALRHDALRMYALTSPMKLPRDILWDLRERGLGHHMRAILANCFFQVAYMSPDIQLTSMAAMPGATRFSSFQAVDPYPQVGYVTESIHDIKFFKNLQPNLKDVIVTPDQVPEMMDMILKAQSKNINEIKRKEQSRRNWEVYGDQVKGEVKPAHEVHVQLITLAG